VCNCLTLSHLYSDISGYEHTRFDGASSAAAKYTEIL
jgi:hypothetical protein